MNFCEVSPDFWRFTVSDFTAFGDVKEELGVKFEQVGRGRYLYRYGMKALGGAIQVFWEGVAGNSEICVQISGEGCRLIEAAENFPGWIQWIAMWVERYKAKTTRFDLAIDDLEARVPFEIVEQSVRQGDIASRHRYWKYDESKGKHGIGRTMYVGGRTSECMLRCYERGVVVGAEKPWLRFEFEFKGKKADMLVSTLIGKGWEAAVACCRGEVDFLDPFDEDSVRSRRARAPWWLELCESGRHCLKVARTVVTTLQKRYQWVLDQVAPSLFALNQVQGGAREWLDKLIHDGGRRLNDRTKGLVEMGHLKVFADDFRSFVPV